MYSHFSPIYSGFTIYLNSGLYACLSPKILAKHEGLVCSIYGFLVKSLTYKI